MPDSALPPHLQGTFHWDWIWPFSRIPRGWTAFDWGRPFLHKGWGLRGEDFAPGFCWGTDHPRPITSPGTWQLSRFPEGPWYAWYFAWSGKVRGDGMFRHFRIGARWDNVDDYVQWPTIAFRRYTGDDSQDTGTK